MADTVETDIPARLDRLPWSRWHTRIITALGTSWLLDGLEVTLVGSLSGVLESKSGLSLTDPQVTAAATTYLAGADGDRTPVGKQQRTPSRWKGLKAAILVPPVL